MDFNLFLGLFSTLGLGYMYIGYQAAQNVKTLDDYFLAGRQLGLFALTIALIATQLGGGIILGTSKEAYSYGIYGIMYVVGISIGFLVLASGFAAHLRRFNVNTTAELFQTEFKSEHLKKIASLLSMLSLCGILLAQVVASRNLMLSLNVYSETIFILFWLFVIGYTMLGGLRAIVSNDIFQLAFIIAVFCSIFAYELIGNPCGVITTLTSTPLFDFSSFFSWSRLLAIVIIPACYSLIEQDIAQTLFAARSPKIALVGTFIASIFMLCFALIPVYFGMQAQRLGLIIPEGANPLISLFDQTYSPALVTLVVYGVFAAIISTADALLCAISSHLVQDFNLTAHSKYALTISKSVTFSIGIAALVLGRYFSNIIDIIIGSYDIPVTTLFVPLLWCYSTMTRSISGAYASIILGLLGFILFKILGLGQQALPEILAITISFLGYLSGYYYDKNQNKLIYSRKN